MTVFSIGRAYARNAFFGPRLFRFFSIRVQACTTEGPGTSVEENCIQLTHCLHTTLYSVNKMTVLYVRKQLKFTVSIHTCVYKYALTVQVL